MHENYSESPRVKRGVERADKNEARVSQNWQYGCAVARQSLVDGNAFVLPVESIGGDEGIAVQEVVADGQAAENETVRKDRKKEA